MSQPDPDFWAGKPVAVTGGAGFLGKPTVRMLEALDADVRAIRSAEHDLRDPTACDAAVEGADVVIHLAANVGGIGYNLRNPGPLAFDNTLMGVNVFESCRRLEIGEARGGVLGVRLSEARSGAVLRGRDLGRVPEESNAPYGLAKRMLAVLSDAYRRQYEMDSCVPVLANLYGPDDNFDLEDSHVIAALIHKYVSAAELGEPEVVLWGTGSPTREFLYVDDAARALLLAAEGAGRSEPFNVGTGVETAIRDLAETISSLVGYEGDTVWDSARPDGQPKRYLDVTRAREWLGFEAETPLEEGLRRTIESFRANRVRG